MVPILSNILVGILTSLGWKKLIISVAEDTFYYIATKMDNDLAKKTLQNMGDALKELEDKPL